MDIGDIPNGVDRVFFIRVLKKYNEQELIVSFVIIEFGRNVKKE